MNTAQALKSTRGRFFTLTTKSGTINAQLRKLNPKTALVFDRNNDMVRRVSYSTIRQVNKIDCLN